MGIREHGTFDSPCSDNRRRPARGLRSFHRQYRELAKNLPVSEPWPGGRDMRDVLKRYGLAENAPADAIPVPARITSDVYLVGQDRVSNLTYMIDCGPEGVAIIDPTYASEFERTLTNVEKCGRNRKEIRWIVNTHCHVDHAMADKQFRDLGAKIAVHEADAAAIEKGSRVTAYYLIKEDTGKAAPFPHCPIDMRLADGEELHLGNKTGSDSDPRTHAGFRLFSAQIRWKERAVFGRHGAL
jgi:hypothetical protein